MNDKVNNQMTYEDGWSDGVFHSFQLLKEKLLRDPTMGATGQHAQGYREALNDLKNELDEMIRKHNDF